MGDHFMSFVYSTIHAELKIFKATLTLLKNSKEQAQVKSSFMTKKESDVYV